MSQNSIEITQGGRIGPPGRRGRGDGGHGGRQRDSQQDSQFDIQQDSQQSQTYRWTQEKLKVMVSWMQDNRSMLKGKQLDWYKKLKDEKFHNDRDITVSKIQEKVHNMRRAYKKAKEIQAQSGQGVCLEDNPDTINAVLNKKCPFFWELDDVWKDRPNMVSPTRSETRTGPPPLDEPELNDHADGNDDYNDDNATSDQNENDDDIEMEISKSNAAIQSATPATPQTRDIHSRSKTPSTSPQSTKTSKWQNTSRIDQALFDLMKDREEMLLKMEERRLRLEEDRMAFEREKLAAERESRQTEINALKDIMLAALSAGSRAEVTERRQKRRRYSRSTSRRRSCSPARLTSHFSKSRSGSPYARASRD